TMNAGGEQGLEDLLPTGGVRIQRLPESPLRQEDHLAELLEFESEEPPDLAIHIGGPRRQRMPGAIAPARELGAGGLRHVAVPGAPARTRLFRRPARAVALGAERELEDDLGGQLLGRMVAAHLRGAPLAAGAVAVECDADRVEDA